jgi:predicted RNase H-like HicB family nuclease
MINYDVEIIFEVTEDLIDGGYVAAAIGHGITTEADTLDNLRSMIKDAVQCHFHDAGDLPKIIRLHFVRDEVLAL